MTFEEFESEWRRQVREYGGGVPQEAVDMAEQAWEIAFNAGAASRDAEIAEFVAALESAREMIGHPDNIAIIDAALSKVRKP